MILMVKATSLVSIITLMEVTGIALSDLARPSAPIEVFIVAGAIYFVVNFLMTRVIHGARMAAVAASAPAARRSSRERRRRHA